jgi:hypothetical protein
VIPTATDIVGGSSAILGRLEICSGWYIFFFVCGGLEGRYEFTVGWLRLDCRVASLVLARWNYLGVYDWLELWIFSCA